MVEVYENYLFVSDLVWLLDLPVKDPTHGRKFVSKITKGIVFDHVTFKYPGTDKTIIKDVSFTVNPEENMALIGLNGAGKSTLVKLLCGFYRPDQGRITIDGIEVTAFQQSDYWSKLAVLFQDFESYSFSARENIGLGDARRIGDLQAIRQAAKLVDIDSWIMSLPKGYDTPLSRMYEDSVIPSGGQLQRIAIARTLFKHSSIMILDEPTSSVDPQAEEEIFNQILTIGHKKILMFISHRFSTVRKADRILVLDSGTITESGTHQELMRQKGTYAKLFTLQAKSYQ
jgi:ATP-binding cassette subfamily B protein